jgi:hypothetical protein
MRSADRVRQPSVALTCTPRSTDRSRIDFDPADLGEVKLKGTEAQHVWFGHDDNSRQLVVEDILILDKLQRDKKCTGTGPSQECDELSRENNFIEIDLGKETKYKKIAIVNTLTGDLTTAKGAVLRVYDADKNLIVETKPTPDAWEVYEYDFLVRKWREATHYKYGYTDEPPE